MPSRSSVLAQRAALVISVLCAACASPPALEGGPGPAEAPGHSAPASSPEPAAASAQAAAPASAPTSAPVVEARAEVSADAGAAPSPADAGCPEGMARIGRSCIDRWEAHLVTRAEGGEAVPFPHAQRPEKGVVYEARTAPGVFPQAYISRVEAQAACRAAGKRLCSMSEWTRACRGKRWTTYPYGNKGQSGRCNTGKPHLLPARFGNDPRRWKYDEHFNDPSLCREPGFLARTGEHAGCVSEAGVHDQVGNLHEWVSDSVDEKLYRRLADEDVERNDQPWHHGNGVFMGGFFSTTRELGPGCRFVTIAHEPRYHDYSTGFRCCAAATGDPPPEPPPAKPRKKPR